MSGSSSKYLKRHTVAHKCCNNRADVCGLSTAPSRCIFLSKLKTVPLLIHHMEFTHVFFVLLSSLHLEIHQVQLIAAISRTMTATFLCCRIPKFRLYGAQWWEPFARQQGHEGFSPYGLKIQNMYGVGLLPERAAEGSTSESGIPTPCNPYFKDCSQQKNLLMNFSEAPDRQQCKL